MNEDYSTWTDEELEFSIRKLKHLIRKVDDDIRMQYKLDDCWQRHPGNTGPRNVRP